jgi:hypothetical protein
VCDLKIWDNNLVIRYGISDLPYSILINPKSLNISYNTTPEKKNASLDSIIKAYKKEVEEEKKREKEREREKKRKKKKNKNKK